MEEQKEEIDAQQKKRVEQMVKSGGEVNILDAAKIDLTSDEIGKQHKRGCKLVVDDSLFCHYR